MREAPSNAIINGLLEKGSKVRVYDPQAMEEAQKVLGEIADRIIFCKHACDTAEDVDAIIIVTEWNEFRNMDFMLLKKIMPGNTFYDATSIYLIKDIEELGFMYIGTGL